MNRGQEGDYFFISHAVEDNPLSDWLALKLTTLGYKVWYDRFDLLGGERFSRDITTAISGAFRVLALVSRASKEKENPVKEWTAAINIGRERKVDFLIPIMVEQMSPTELPWQLSDITWVPFSDNWATGLSQLVEKLEKINAPKTVDNGGSIAKDALARDSVISNEPEILHSNIIRISRIPAAIYRFELSRRPSPPESDWIERNWPVFWVGRDRKKCLSFQQPQAWPADASLQITRSGATSWEDFETLDAIKTENIISNLLKKSIEVKCFQKGIKRSEKGPFAGRRVPGHRKINGPLYFPSGLLNRNKIEFIRGEKKRWLLVNGQRTKLGKKFLYYLSPDFVVRQDLLDRFSILMRVKLLVISKDGEPLTSRKALSYRKQVCKNWWNDQWLSRYLAIIYFLSEGDRKIVVGTGAEAIEFCADFINFEADFGIDENMLGTERTEDEEKLLEVIMESEDAEETRDD